MRIKIYPHKMGSQGAKLLARQLGCARVFENGNYRPKRNHLVINWGNSTSPPWWQPFLPTLNMYDDVAWAINKHTALITWQDNDIPIPRFTTDINEALQWGTSVMGREVLNGTGGAGCVYVKRGEIERDRQAAAQKLANCRLFVEFIPNCVEYRIHVFDGEVIDVQQKKRRQGSEASSAIKNLANGWVYTREGVDPPAYIISAAVAAVGELQLDFGAVDIMDKNDRAYVLEVNTAPGLEGSTVLAYTNAILEYVNELS